MLVGFQSEFRSQSLACTRGLTRALDNVVCTRLRMNLIMVVQG